MLGSEYIVLGSTGMLGQALLSEIKNRNKTVVGIARNEADICFDITDDKKLLETIDRIKPKVIINTASIVSLSYCEKKPSESYMCNSRVSGVLSGYCAVNGIKYVYISTDHYFSGDKDKKHLENDAVILCNEYAISKYLGEKLSLVNDSSLVVRTNIVGFRHSKDRLTFIEWVIKSLEKKDPIILFDNIYTSSIDVYSFAKLLCDLICKNTNGILNLASSEVSSKKQFIVCLANRLNLSLENTSIGPMKNETDLIRGNSLGLDVSRVESILGISMPTLSDVIGNIVTEYLKGKK